MITMDDTGLRIDVEEMPGETMVTLSGELDLANVETLAHALDDLHPAPGVRVVVDLGHLDFLGVCGAAALATAAGNLRDKNSRFQIVRPTALARRLLHMSGLEVPTARPAPPCGRVRY